MLHLVLSCVLWFFVLDAGTIYQESEPCGKNAWLAAEVREEPEDERKDKAEEKASHDGEIEGGVFAAVDDVAGKSSEAEREFAAEEQKRTHDDEEAA
jgi:hypothetical protein